MTEITYQEQLDFDHWMNMAKNNPEEFESMRSHAIDEVIDSAPKDRQMHLRRLQWRIDMARKRAGSPMAATLIISKMMWEAFHNLKEHYEDLFTDEVKPTHTAKSAKVIAFRPQLVEA